MKSSCLTYPNEGQLKLLTEGKDPMNPQGAASGFEIFDQYVSTTHCSRNALDISQGEWFSGLPEPYADLKAGQSELFGDARIHWFSDAIGGFEGQTVLE